ncbi:Branched-chain amino acid transport system / permease component [Meiothermus luteus]|uniref:Branched-chain amino acid transport system / permease component n=1 Tax=Meiothermus luteus TaxID=2026184 RepID=A0A399EEU5_9DEIN|nr:ABC transporter permease [Meiothermus luteus]RIH83154.1 Branched-chain amino acid transport system / permease component [Meiothermus luteus]RMH55236.1 MAG: ABC transporter permease [Deinococcota bacterium]
MGRLLFFAASGAVLLAMALAPWAIPLREFDGTGYLLSPLGTINPKGLSLPEGLSFPWLGPLFGAWVALIVAAIAVFLTPNPQARARLLYVLGGLGIALFAVGALLFYQAVGSANEAALAAGARRPPLRRFALSLGMYAGLFYALALLLLARMQLPGGLAFLVRLRGVVVPLVSLLLAVVVGAVVVAILRPGLGTQGVEGLGLREFIASKLDLVTYTFQILFSPLLSLPGLFNSLAFATPLIFTGLAVAFGFRAGMFNIGAPGQLTIGALFAMLAGVYLPLPGFLLLPSAILAAALGGAIWGGIVGWLKARFGANEVINTIMMNYIAASVLLFMLAANEYRFFGQTVRLPFKAEGFEGRSEEMQEGARIPLMIDLLAPGGTFSWALPVAVGAGLLTYYGLRRLDLGRRLLLATAATLLGFGLGGLLPGFPVTISSALASQLLNGSFLIAVAALLFYNFYLFRTAGGYELRATGLAPKAAEYAGVSLRRKMVVAMLISGALAGLAATHYVLGAGMDGTYRLKTAIPSSVGFDGIAVALMGQNTPIGIFLSATLFGILLAGGVSLNAQLGISNQIIQVLQALIILFIAVGGLLPRYFTDPLRAAQVETEAKAEQEAQPAQRATL